MHRFHCQLFSSLLCHQAMDRSFGAFRREACDFREPQGKRSFRWAQDMNTTDKVVLEPKSWENNKWNCLVMIFPQWKGIRIMSILSLLCLFDAFGFMEGLFLLVDKPDLPGKAWKLCLDEVKQKWNQKEILVTDYGVWRVFQFSPRAVKAKVPRCTIPVLL